MFVYLITNMANGMEYVGTTVQSVERRFGDHRNAALGRAPRTSPLYDAIREHGIARFSLRVMFETDNYEAMLAMERCLIAERATLVPHGYNQVSGGRGDLGWKPKPETRARMAAKARARVGDKNPFFGRTHSPEARAKNRAAHVGHCSDVQRETLRRNAEATKGKPRPDAVPWLIGEKNHNARPVQILGVRYGSLGDAVRGSGLTRMQIRYRLRMGREATYLAGPV